MVLKFLYHSRLDTDLTVEDSEETKTGMVQLTQQQLEYMLMVQSSDLQENGLKFHGYNPFEYSNVNTTRKNLSGTRETFAIYTPDSRVRYVVCPFQFRKSASAASSSLDNNYILSTKICWLFK